MPECSFEYAIIRVVPRVERGEFLNAGAIVFCLAQEFLQARIEIDEVRLKSFAPYLDFAAVAEHLNVIPRICAGGIEAGPIGAMTQRERFHWLVAPRSTMIQLSPVHSGLCRDPAATLEYLIETMVRLPIAR